jgi:ATP-independent RNA helicase DbpA
MSAPEFSLLDLPPDFLENIRSLDYRVMTPIQAQGLPVILEQRDLLAQAKTGSGKTAAFAIGLLRNLDTTDYLIQALVVCPTRELSDQVSQEIRRLARSIPNTKILTLCGGKPMGPQLASLNRNAHVVVGTPGRLLKLLEKRALNLGHVKTLVLDEADRMLEMGFYDDIMKIVRNTPNQRQTLLFSATYPNEIQKVSGRIQTDPVELRLDIEHDESDIQQQFYSVGKQDRDEKLISLLKHIKPDSCLVFCTTRQQCQELADTLGKTGISALALHGDLEQFERDQALVQFSNHSLSILVATDVAARGLDIKDLSAVVNYELTPDPEMHVHRVGRTGRAGKTGLAISLVSENDLPRIKAIEEYTGIEVKLDQDAIPRIQTGAKLIPAMSTLFIHGGRKNKVRAGDILGALTADGYLAGSKIGKINIFDTFSYVAVTQGFAKQAFKILSNRKIKGKSFRVRQLR